MKASIMIIMAGLALFVSAGLPGQPAAAADEMAGTTFHVQDPMGRNAITFKSLAPLEDIVGTTNQITGQIVFDPLKPDKGVHAKFAVPVASLNTGIPLRDEHLRSADWMDANGYPEIGLVVDTIEKIEPVKTSDEAKTFDAVVSGTFSMRGMSKAVSFPARVTWLKESEMTQKRLPGDLLAVRAGFEIALEDFGVTGPKGAGLVGSKVGKTITVEVNLMGNTAPPAESGK